MSVPICPLHLCRMRGERQEVESQIQTYSDAPATRMVYHCPKENCPRVTFVNRTFHPSYAMKKAGKGYMKNIERDI